MDSGVNNALPTDPRQVSRASPVSDTSHTHRYCGRVCLCVCDDGTWGGMSLLPSVTKTLHVTVGNPL